MTFPNLRLLPAPVACAALSAIGLLLAAPRADARDPVPALEEKWLVPVSEKDWHFGPRIGVSHATGVLGIEVQRKHFAVAYGVIPVCVYECNMIETASLKYYLDATGDSWAVGAFSWNDSNGWGDVIGIAVEHRWRFGSGWDLAVGLATAEKGKNIEIETPMPSVSFGFSF